MSKSHFFCSDKILLFIFFSFIKMLFIVIFGGVTGLAHEVAIKDELASNRDHRERDMLGAKKGKRKEGLEELK